MITSDQQSVALDGDAVRLIREQKRLTQLYVSKVVGVTTDTVSRWENNRYPTIRRENAVKLAEALEVELEAILKIEPPPASASEIQPEPALVTRHLSRHSSRLFAVVAVAVAVIGLAFIWLVVKKDNPFNAPELQAERIVPAHAAPGSQFLVQMTIETQSPLSGMIVKESLPPGTRLIAAQPEAASIDKERGIIRWIFRQPPPSLQLLYRLELDSALSLRTVLEIDGEITVNPDGQQPVHSIAASSGLVVRPLHWVDSNANQAIDDLEILVFSELTENTTLVDDQWQLLEDLWHAGGYQWDDQQREFVPLATKGNDP